MSLFFFLVFLVFSIFLILEEEVCFLFFFFFCFFMRIFISFLKNNSSFCFLLRACVCVCFLFLKNKKILKVFLPYFFKKIMCSKMLEDFFSLFFLLIFKICFPSLFTYFLVFKFPKYEIFFSISFISYFEKFPQI